MEKKIKKATKAIKEAVKKVAKKEVSFISLSKKQRMEARKGHAK